MNQLSKKAIASILSLVLVFVALGATTFAWFTLGTTATVGQFNLTARGSEGLEIQLDGYNDEWLSTINTDTMNAFIATKLTGNKTLDAVTTNDGKTFLAFDKVSDLGVVGTKKITAANEKYLEFTMNFRTMSREAKLDLSELVFDSKPEDWVADVDYTNENTLPILAKPGTKLTLNPHYAARVSFTSGDAASESKAKTYQHKLNPLTTGTEMGNIGFDLANGAHSYLAAKVGLTQLNVDDATAYTDYANSAKVFETSTDNNLATFTDPEEEKDYSTTSVTVRIWLEGWDSNTYDAIFNGKLMFNFKFDLVKTP